MPSFKPADIEPRWQQYWETHKTFRTPDTDGGKPKYYILDMFPYPSGSGLHVGHPEGYTATDILARYKRMSGFHVLHPMGWDAFGLPAEQHAIATGEHPSINTQNNINTFRRQIKSLGFSYDWDREVDTTDPNYFKWTQWIFLLLYDTWFDVVTKRGCPISELPIPSHIQGNEQAIREYRDSHRLAYFTEAPVNWCEFFGTVLSNEEVIDGKSERGGHPVVRRPLKQWFMRITAYADRLIDDLKPLEWTESIKQMQRNWIGRSEGAEVDFRVDKPESIMKIRVYTTRPDTLYGATFLCLSPEHSLVDQITTPEQRESVIAYRDAAARKSDLERTDLAKTKSGVHTGSFAINPVNNKRIPIYVADYVLSYGTGAIMAVPGHDERDFEFAKTFDLPIIGVVKPPIEWMRANGKKMLQELSDAEMKNNTFDDKGILQGIYDDTLIEYYLRDADWYHVPYTDDGLAINSGMLNGMTTEEAKRKITAWLVVEGKGEAKTNYKLRDWLFSRQRYWGEPFPILHGPNGEVVPVPVSELPLTLPEMTDYKPTGSPDGPLAKATDWLTVKKDGTTFRRETNTMPQWAGSCWYFLRYIDPHNDQAFADPAKLKHWLPVDLYVGGAEHAVLHLLYSRFWHKVLFDRGYVHCVEPFQRLVNQGMILGENNEKMSKSRGNVINPDDVVDKYGADSLRLYEMFMGPLEAVKPWSMKGVEGVYRFLGRVWRLLIDDESPDVQLNKTVQNVEPDKDTLRILHRTIQKVSEDTEGLKFNTAISAMMEFVNHMTKLEIRPRSALETFVLLLAPYAPHTAEELWNMLKCELASLFNVTMNTLAYEPWPKYDPALTKADEIEVPVQVNGKLRSKLTVPAEIESKALEALALSDLKVVEMLAGKPPKKVIVIPKKLVNIVV